LTLQPNIVSLPIHRKQHPEEDPLSQEDTAKFASK